MDLRDLDYFAVVAEHRHIGRAAESLDLSQPALSLSLRRLEKALQAKVVRRTPKGVELTAVGSALLLQVRKLRLAQKDVVRECSDLREGRSGRLHIGVGPGIAETLAGEVSAVLMTEAPNVTVRIDVITQELMTSALENGDIDLCISAVSPVSPGIRREQLFDDQFVVYASAGHRLARQRKTLPLSDLVRERWSVSTADTGRQRLNRVFEESGLPAPQFALESNSITARIRAIASSSLLGFSSRRFVHEQARRFRLVELSVKEIAVIRRMGVCYRNEAYLSPVARRFIELLKNGERVGPGRLKSFSLKK